MKILICEDDPTALKSLMITLEQEGYEIVTTSNGDTAKEILKSDFIDILITDLYLPGSDGLNIIKFTRDKLHKDIPIILLTIEGNEQVVLQAFHNGADDYIVKPFNPDELCLRLKKVIIRNKK